MGAWIVKYMGSKRAMLNNGLGDLLNREVEGVERFIDLFAGSGAVSIHVARKYSVPVQSFDLQLYSAVLAGAVIQRQTKVNWEKVWLTWSREAKVWLFVDAPTTPKLSRHAVNGFRTWCDEQLNLPITKAYGGHYFSPTQSVWLDALRATLPKREPARTIALASLIQTASKCAAAPGHTAQPFQPTSTAIKYLEISWKKDILVETSSTLELLSQQFAQIRGKANVADAMVATQQIRETDLVFIDPPYSGVHYSRFYHVLETIAQGECGEVSGTGRYPATELRPRSSYSVISESKAAIRDLLKAIALQGAKVVLTFPDHDCSNGLSGEMIRDMARDHFLIKEKLVKSKFSSLGGTSKANDSVSGRAARKSADELILVLSPK